MLKNYELMLVLSPEVDEERADGALNRVTRFITDQGGEVSKQEKWGKRRLAYPINHFTEGNYILTQFTLEPSLTKELAKSLKLTEEVIRHLLVNVDS